MRLTLRKNKEFFIARLQTEWDEAERAEKREKILQYAKDSGAIIAKGLLVLLAVAGVVTIATVASNLFAAVGHLKGRKRFYHKNEFQRAVRYLKKKNYIMTQRENDEYTMQLTSEGADIILTRSLKDLQIQQHGQWDGCWRMVIFDIPDRHKWARDAFRKKLQEMGFYRLQESVFVYPYECAKEISFLTMLYSIPDYIRLVRTNEISYEADLKDFFLLS